MTTKQTKIVANKGGSGGETFRTTLPVSWLRKMDVDENNLDIELTFDETAQEIKIKKLKAQ